MSRASRPIRFGIQASGLWTAEEFVAFARKAEDLGYSALTLPDHFDGQLAPLIALMAAADATTTLRLQSLVLGNDYRHPVIVAKEAATLDLLSGGRFDLGLGAGWMRSDYESAGMPYDKPSVRIARLREAVTIIKRCLSGERFSFEGEHYQVHDFAGSPMPVQSPPPLLLAGGGQKMLTLAGNEADTVGLNPGLAAGVIDERAGASATEAATDAKIGWVKAAAGERFAAIELQTRLHMAVITDDREGLAEAMAPALGVTPADALRSPHALAGTVEQCVETIEWWRERWGITYVTFSGSALDEFAPVVAALA